MFTLAFRDNKGNTRILQSGVSFHNQTISEAHDLIFEYTGITVKGPVFTLIPGAKSKNSWYMVKTNTIFGRVVPMY